MAIQTWSVRNIRWLLAGPIVRATPLSRAIIMYDKAVAADAAGDIVDGVHERLPMRFDAYEQALVDRLPASVKLQHIPPVVERDIRLLRFENHTLLGDTGSLVDEAREKLVVFRGMYPFPTYHSFRPLPLRLVEKGDGTYVNMLGSWRGHRHIFHFLIDRFPKLYYLLERFGHGDRPLKVVVHADMPGYQEDLYRFLLARYPRLELARIPTGERWRVRDLLCVENWQNTKMTLADPASLAFTAGLFRDGYKIVAGEPRRRIYVSREDTKRRRIENEAEVRAALADHGVEPVLAAKLRFEEQVRLFAEAAVVVGAHGAGLTNILFAPSSLRLLEIFPSNKPRNTYFLQSRSQGQIYRYLFAGASGRRERFSVESRALRKAMDELLTAEPAPGAPALPADGRP